MVKCGEYPMSVNDKTTIIKITYILSIVSILISIINVYGNIHFNKLTDDAFFYNYLNDKSLIEAIQLRYREWSGRVFIESFLMLTISNGIFPKLIIISSLMMASASIAYVLSKDRLMFVLYFSFSLFLITINYHTSRQAILWITGAYNYIIPFSIGILGVSIYIKRYKNLFISALSLILVFLACNNEQFAVTCSIGMAFNIIYRLYKREKIAYDIIFLLSSLAGALIVLSAPGNIVRMNAEVYNWMPFFNDMSVLQKLSIGIDRVSNDMNTQGNVILIVLSILIIINTAMRGKLDTSDIIIVSVMSFKMITMMYSYYPDRTMISEFYSRKYIQGINWFDIKFYFGYFINMIYVSSLIIYISKSLCCEREKVSCLIILACGVLSGIMIGMSPTAYESGTRVMYLMNLSFAMITCFAFSETLKTSKIIKLSYS